MYKTELTEEILKSENAQKMLQMVSPIYGEAYTVLWLYQVIGAVVDMMEEWVMTISDQTRPQTATWSIPYWEDQYKITPEPGWTDEQRRQNIISTRQSRKAVNPRIVENMLSGIIGVPVKINELVDLYTFEIVILGHFTDLDYARQIIDKVIPAHLTYFFSVRYEEELTTPINYNIYASEMECYDVFVKNDDIEILEIIQQPQDFSGELNETAVFSVIAQGEGLTYQWYYSNNNGKSWYESRLTGYNTDTQEVVITDARNNQQYRCIIKDVYGNTVTSDAAKLTIS